MKLEVVVVPVSDVDKAKDFYQVSVVFHDADGVFHHAGTEERAAGPAPNHQSYGSFVSFSDPDGNGWFVQEITTRLPGPVRPMPATYASAADAAQGVTA